MNKIREASPLYTHLKGKVALSFSLGIALGAIPAMAFAQSSPYDEPRTVTGVQTIEAQPPIPQTPKEAGSEDSSKDYLILRYNEDWSYLRDPSKSRNFLDPLKYIPLDDAGDVYLTLFGDERIRNINESTKNVAPKSDGENFTAIRTDFGADLHMTPYFRSFVEFVSGYDLGSHLGVRPSVFDNPLDVLQLFVEPMTQIDDVKLGLRLGREVMKWGNGTVIDPNDFPNVQTAFDAIHPYAEWQDWRIDAFVSDAVSDLNRSFHDANNPNIKLDGIYVVKKYEDFAPFGVHTEGTIEPFYYHYASENAKYGVQVGQDLRRDYGLRVTANFAGFDFDEQALSQTGTFANREVDAWAYFANQGYTVSALPLSPRIGLQADGASGGDAKHGTTIQTYQPMFPSVNYLSDMDFFADANLIVLRPNLTLHFTPTISLQGLYGFYSRQNTGDAIYAASPFRAYASTAINQPKGSEIGEVPQLIFSWAITPQVLFTQYASTLLPSPSLVQAGGGKGDVFFATTLLLRF
jgi:Alginate export